MGGEAVSEKTRPKFRQDPCARIWPEPGDLGSDESGCDTVYRVVAGNLVAADASKQAGSHSSEDRSAGLQQHHSARARGEGCLFLRKVAPGADTRLLTASWS